MSDGIKSGIGGAIADITEAVVNPAIQEAKEAGKEVAQTAFGYNPTQDDPQEIAKRKTQAENQRQFWQKYIQDQQQLDQEKKQKEQLTKQVEHQEDQVKQVDEIKTQEKKQNIAVSNAQRGIERKVGTG